MIIKIQIKIINKKKMIIFKMMKIKQMNFNNNNNNK